MWALGFEPHRCPSSYFSLIGLDMTSWGLVLRYVAFSKVTYFNFLLKVTLDCSYLNWSLSFTHQVPILFFLFLTDFWRIYSCEHQSHHPRFVIWPKISRNSQSTWWDRTYIAWHKWDIQILHKGMNPLAFFFDWPVHLWSRIQSQPSPSTLGFSLFSFDICLVYFGFRLLY